METNAKVYKYYKFTGEDSLLDYFDTEDMHLFKGNATLKCTNLNAYHQVMFEGFNDWVDITEDLHFFEEVPNPCITSTKLTKLEIGKCYRWVGPKYTSGNRPKGFDEKGYMDFIMDGRTYKYDNEMTNYADMMPLTGDLPSDNHWKWYVACPYLEEVKPVELPTHFKWVGPNSWPEELMNQVNPHGEMDFILDGKPHKVMETEPCGYYMVLEGSNIVWNWEEFMKKGYLVSCAEPSSKIPNTGDQTVFKVGHWYRATKNLTEPGALNGRPRRCVKVTDSKITFRSITLKSGPNDYSYTPRELEKYEFIEDGDKTMQLPEDTTISKFEVGRWYKPCKGEPVQVLEIDNNCVTFTDKSYCNINDHEFYKPYNKCEDTNLPKLKARPWYEPILTLLNCRHFNDPGVIPVYYVNKSGYLWYSLNSELILNSAYWSEDQGGRYNSCRKTRIRVGYARYWDKVLFRFNSKSKKYELEWQDDGGLTTRYNGPCPLDNYRLEGYQPYCRDYSLCEAINKGEDPNAIIMPEEKGTEVEKKYVGGGYSVIEDKPEVTWGNKEPSFSIKGHSCNLIVFDEADIVEPTTLDKELRIKTKAGFIGPKKDNSNKKLWLLFLALNASGFTKEQFILLYFIWIKTL